MSAQSGNLPRYLTRFIGREREMAQLKEMLTTRQTPRLITLTGMGGSGKTRLAAEVARAFSRPGADEHQDPFRHGVRWVGLSSLSEPVLAPQAVAAALGLREATGHSPTDAVIAALRQAHLLLVLDNCEQLAGACGALAQQLLAGCPRLVILATSRTPLSVAEESIFAVPPLKTVDEGAGLDGAYLAQGEAVQLFLDRATMMLSGYTINVHNVKAVNQICRCLDGLPLAIELAASWIRVLSAQDILKQVEQSLDFLSSSEPTLAPRHRSMRAVLDYSWRRLAGEQQRVFATLAVLSGSFSREAAETVAETSLSSLAALAENSLLQRLPGGEGSTRYQFHEVVRQYALDRLESYSDGSSERARHQHLDFFLALAEQAAQTWDTAQETVWLNRLRVEHDNLRTAVGWAIGQAQTEEALRLSSALFTFWIYTTPPEEYTELLRRSLVLPWDDRSSGMILARAKALNVTGYAAAAGSDFPRAMACFQEGLVLYTRLGDERGISWSLRGCGFATLLSGEAGKAQGYVEQSLALCRKSSDAWGEAWSIFDLGHIAFAQGAIERTQPLIEDAYQRFMQMGVLFGAYRALILLGDIQRRHSRWAEAVAFYVEALQLEQENRFGQFGADLLEGLAKIAAVQRQPGTASRLFGAGHAWRQTFGQARSFFYEPGYQRILASAHAQLAGADWSAGYEVGRSLTSEQAMAEARQAWQVLASASLAPYPAGLTEREVEVLNLVAEGLKDQEIADQLVVSPRTVHAHLRSIYGKLGVSTRTAAAREALQLQLV
jgi:predicted ATPase/DNA-binding CsgD family transcriptional regulator